MKINQLRLRKLSLQHKGYSEWTNTTNEAGPTDGIALL